MKFEKIEDGLPPYNPIKYPISVCFEISEVERWNKIKHDLKLINKRANISTFARAVIKDMMTNLEQLIKEHKAKENL